jgi:hypothetical protein
MWGRCHFWGHFWGNSLVYTYIPSYTGHIFMRTCLSRIVNVVVLVIVAQDELRARRLRKATQGDTGNVLYMA